MGTIPLKARGSPLCRCHGAPQAEGKKGESHSSGYNNNTDFPRSQGLMKKEGVVTPEFHVYNV